MKRVINAVTGEVTMVPISVEETATFKEPVQPATPLSPAQFWMQLAIDGDEAAALAIIDTLPRPQQILATKAKDYRIDDPLLLQLAAALGKSAAQIDSFFRKAAKL
jgi:hypothetical protein